MENELVWLSDSDVVEAKVSMRNHPVDAVQVAIVREGHELDVLVAGVRRATAMGPGRFALPISWNRIVLEFVHIDGQRSQYSHCVDCTPDFLFKGDEPRRGSRGCILCASYAASCPSPPYGIRSLTGAS